MYRNRLFSSIFLYTAVTSFLIELTVKISDSWRRCVTNWFLLQKLIHQLQHITDQHKTGPVGVIIQCRGTTFTSVFNVNGKEWISISLPCAGSWPWLSWLMCLSSTSIPGLNPSSVCGGESQKVKWLSVKCYVEVPMSKTLCAIFLFSHF